MKYIVFIIFVMVVSLIYVLFPIKHNIPAIYIGALSLVLVSAIFPEIRFDIQNIISPLNVAISLFIMQLVALPAIMLLIGGSLYVLPYFPSDSAINLTLLLNSIAFIFFATGFHLRRSFKIFRTDMKKGCSNRPKNYPGTLFGFGLLAMGVLSIILTFGNFEQFISQFINPFSRLEYRRNLAGTWQGVFASFFKFSFGYGVAIFWSRWADNWKTNNRRHNATAILILSMAAIVVFNFSYNRGSMVLPLLALLGAFSLRVFRISLKSVGILGIIVLGAALIWGSYRQSEFSGREILVNRDAQMAILEKTKVWDMAQVYFGSPQFTAFLIENMNYGSPPLWGSSVLGSIMHPVPQIGKAFREISGVTIYNRLIYGNLPSEDQVIPVLGELFVNFNVPGIIIGYLLIGLIIGLFNDSFLASVQRPSIYSYVILYMGLWTTVTFLSLSLAVASQMYIYAFFPGYLVLLYLRIKRPIRSND